MPQFGAGQPQPEAAGRKKGSQSRTQAGVDLCREAEVLLRAIQTANVLYGMLALRQAQAKTPEEQLAFARDDSNVRLAEAVLDSYMAIAPYGHAKLKSYEFVGDVPVGPQRVENRMTFVLNVGDAPGKPQAVAIEAPIIEHAAGRANGNGADEPADDAELLTE